MVDTSTVKLRNAKRADLPLIQSWLRQNSLPDSDVSDVLDGLFIMQHQNVDVGIGGIEAYAPDGLLRSVVIAEPFRGKGYGKQLCHLLVNQAIAQNITTLFLLTETAPQFFASLGFEPIERQSAPTSLQGTTEFSQLCPASAICMKRNLDAIAMLENAG
ncbi:MAG: arsenic resistance N-acetyltransferase ArsN2 [Elainellaceae cyanobacterium]